MFGPCIRGAPEEEKTAPVRTFSIGRGTTGIQSFWVTFRETLLSLSLDIFQGKGLIQIQICWKTFSPWHFPYYSTKKGGRGLIKVQSLRNFCLLEIRPKQRSSLEVSKTPKGGGTSFPEQIFPQKKSFQSFLTKKKETSMTFLVQLFTSKKTSGTNTFMLILPMVF